MNLSRITATSALVIVIFAVCERVGARGFNLAIAALVQASDNGCKHRAGHASVGRECVVRGTVEYFALCNEINVVSCPVRADVRKALWVLFYEDNHAFRSDVLPVCGEADDPLAST